MTSPQSKVTVTGVLFQAAPLGEGDAVAWITGGVLSRLMVTEALAVLPALSVAVPETTWLAPSLVNVCGCGQLATPEIASPQVNVTVGFVLFQFAALGAGEMVALIDGGSLSIPMT